MNRLPEQERADRLIAILWKAHLEKVEKDLGLPLALDATKSLSAYFRK